MKLSHQGTDQNIKILYLLTDSDFGGTEVSVKRLAIGMAQRGFKVSVCSIKEPGFMATELARQGFYVTSLNLPAVINWNYPFFFLIGLIRWQRLVKKEMPDIIHSFLFQSNLMAAFCRFSLNNKKKVKVIVSSVRCIETNKPGWRIRLDRWALGKADLILSVSKAVKKKYLEREKIQPRKIKVLYHGVESRFFKEQIKNSELLTKLGIERQNILIGTVARLHKDKGISILLEAIALALKSRSQIRLLIIGNGPEKANLIEVAERLGIIDKVIFTGFQPDVLPLMALLDIFCLPSKEEGLPQSLLEAMALGKPVVVSNVGGITELVEDSVTGMLVTPGDSKILCHSVLYLIQNPQKAKNMGNAGRESIRQNFLLDHTIDNMENIYKEMFQLL